MQPWLQHTNANLKSQNKVYITQQAGLNAFNLVALDQILSAESHSAILKVFYPVLDLTFQQGTTWFSTPCSFELLEALTDFKRNAQCLPPERQYLLKYLVSPLCSIEQENLVFHWVQQIKAEDWHKWDYLKRPHVAWVRLAPHLWIFLMFHFKKLHLSSILNPDLYLCRAVFPGYMPFWLL